MFDFLKKDTSSAGSIFLARFCARAVPGNWDRTAAALMPATIWRRETDKTASGGFKVCWT